jgi:hypothetical protein
MNAATRILFKALTEIFKIVAGELQGILERFKDDNYRS